MLYQDHTLWLCFDDLLIYGIAERKLWDALYRSRNGSSYWSHIPDPEDNRRKLINYDSIPEKTLTQYAIPAKDVLIKELELAAKAKQVKTLESVHKLYTIAEDYKHYIKRGLNPSEAAGLTNSSGWLRLLGDVRGKSAVKELCIDGINTKTQLLKEAFRIITVNKPHGLHRISNLAVLKRTLTAWNKAKSESDKLDSLVHKNRSLRGKRKGCQNARKLTQAVEKILLSMWVNTSNDVKMSPVQIHSKYMAMRQAANKAGYDKACGFVDKSTGEVFTDLPDLSLSSVKSLFRRPDVLPLGRLRHGTKWYRDVIRPYVIGTLPKHSFSLTSSDGETAPFWLISKGRITWKRPVAYLIFDVYSQAIVGYSLGLQECKELMQQAFYDLLIKSNGRKPLENQQDNFNKFYQGELEQIVDTVSFCKPYNPQSKYAEPLIKSFESQELKRIPGFVGRNITSKRADSHRNPDKERIGYTFEEIDQIYRAAIERFNNSIPEARKTKKTRKQLLIESFNPGCEYMDDLTMVTLFGSHSTIKMNRGVIRLTVDNQEYVYEIPGYTEMLSKLKNGFSVRVKYLPHNMDKVWIYNYDSSQPSDVNLDEFLIDCPLAIGTQRAKAEQSDVDGRTLGHHLKRVNSMDEYFEKLIEEIPSFGDLVTSEEAESVLASGYTNKPQMQEATEKVENTETVKEPIKAKKPARTNPDIDLRWL